MLHLCEDAVEKQGDRMKKEALEFSTLLEYQKNRYLVGVRFIRTQLEYENLTERELKHQLFYCLMIKAGTVGHIFKARYQNIYCPAASQILGFEKPDERSLNPDIQVKRGFYEKRELAEKVINERPYLTDEVYGLLIGPLEKHKAEPDLVLSISKPYTAMRIIQAYEYKRGHCENLKFGGMSGMCTELTAASMKNNDLSFSLMCSNTRFSASWKDDEVAISMPYDCFLDVLDGLWKTVDVYEPDKKKIEIMKRAKENGLECSFPLDVNYFDSCMGVAPIGVKEYFKKK